MQSSMPERVCHTPCPRPCLTAGWVNRYKRSGTAPCSPMSHQDWHALHTLLGRRPTDARANVKADPTPHNIGTKPSMLPPVLTHHAYCPTTPSRTIQMQRQVPHARHRPQTPTQPCRSLITDVIRCSHVVPYTHHHTHHMCRMPDHRHTSYTPSHTPHRVHVLRMRTPGRTP